jgi:hypothetical protein
VTPDDVAADVATLAAYEGPLWTSSTVRLMRSEMVVLPTGPAPRYTAVATAPLGSA